MSRDLLHQNDVRSAVERAYAALRSGAGRSVVDRLYGQEGDGLPPAAVDWALGVGNPVTLADLQPGETVLDVGCGGGIDSILAAQRVGPQGRVIGLDLLDAMCARARVAASEAGVGDLCEFRTGPMEEIPLPQESVDVIISNGVLNLSPRKARAMAELFRVLRPGGRMAVSDLTVDDDLPPEVTTSDAAWAGWIGGALAERDFADKLLRAGFTDIHIGDRVAFGIDDVASYPLFTPELVALMRRVVPVDQQGRVAVRVMVSARRAG